MTTRNTLATWALCLFSLTVGPVAALDPSATTEGGSAELWVDGPANVQPGNDSLYPDVAVDNNRNSIHVWEAFSAAGGNRTDIFLRRFDADGNPLEDPIFVNTTTDDDQRYPRVAVAADGSFLVIYQSDEPDADAGADRIWVRSQAFDADANKIGTEQILSTLSTAEPIDVNADVAALRGGGYVVVWRSRNTNGNDPNRSIQARLVSATGVPDPAGQFQANSTIGQNDRDPAVTQLVDGGFLVVWVDPEVHGRRFAANGTPIGNDFQINNSAISTGQLDPDVVIGWQSRVLVVWKDSEDPGDDFEIRGRLYDHQLMPLGEDFRINTLSTGVQDNVRAGDYGEGGFFVAWEGESSNGDDNDARSIQARIVTGSNDFAGPQFQLNIWTTGGQETVGVGGWYGRVAIAWRSDGNTDSPNDPVITSQLWDYCDIFCDDFEWGTNWRWSISNP